MRLVRSTHSRPASPEQQSALPRRGAAALDYILVLGVIFPLVLIMLPTGRRMIRLVFEMIAAMVSWPFM